MLALLLLTFFSIILSFISPLFMGIICISILAGFVVYSLFNALRSTNLIFQITFKQTSIIFATLGVCYLSMQSQYDYENEFKRDIILDLIKFSVVFITLFIVMREDKSEISGLKAFMILGAIVTLSLTVFPLSYMYRRMLNTETTVKRFAITFSLFLVLEIGAVCVL